MYPLSRGTRSVYPVRCDRDASVFFTEIELALIKLAIFGRRYWKICLHFKEQQFREYTRSLARFPNLANVKLIVGFTIKYKDGLPRLSLFSYKHFPYCSKITSAKRIEIDTICDRFTEIVSTVPIRCTLLRRIDTYRLMP